jgi:hypothetical protein
VDTFIEALCGHKFGNRDVVLRWKTHIHIVHWFKWSKVTTLVWNPLFHVFLYHPSWSFVTSNSSPQMIVHNCKLKISRRGPCVNHMTIRLGALQTTTEDPWPLKSKFYHWWKTSKSPRRTSQESLKTQREQRRLNGWTTYMKLNSVESLVKYVIALHVEGPCYMVPPRDKFQGPHTFMVMALSRSIH